MYLDMPVAAYVLKKGDIVRSIPWNGTGLFIEKKDV